MSSAAKRQADSHDPASPQTQGTASTEPDPKKRRVGDATATDAVASEADSQPASASTENVSRDLYLDTINRYMLDFDFEKVCSVSLTNLNVYACLVCGKYFQGQCLVDL